MLERLYSDNQPKPPGAILTRLSRDTSAVEIMNRGSIGFYYGTHFDRRLHYEVQEAELSDLIKVAREFEIDWSILKPKHNYVGKYGCDLFVWPGSDPTRLIQSMNLPMVATNSLCPKRGLIAKKDAARGNRGFSVGFVSKIGCTVKEENPEGIIEGIATPCLATGSRRYPAVWSCMNKLLTWIMVHCPSLPRPFQDQIRHKCWLNRIFSG